MSQAKKILTEQESPHDICKESVIAYLRYLHHHADKSDCTNEKRLLRSIIEDIEDNTFTNAAYQL